MVTLTAATASSRPRDPQLMIRVKTPSRHTLQDKQKHIPESEVQLADGVNVHQLSSSICVLHAKWGGGGVMGSNIPNESAPRVSNQTEEYQKANEHVEQQ